jgi:putative cardiolipin synthase
MTGVHADIGAANHQKLLIVDQRYFLTGGRNIETDYYARVGMNERIFRDTDIVVDSPEVAAHATRAFYDEFDSPFTYTVKPRALSKNSTQQITERALQAMDERLHNAILKPETAKEFPILDLYKELASYPRYKFLGKASMANLVFAASNSELHEPLGDRKQDINPRLLELINGAKKSIVLTSPYMIPLTDMLEALKRASARGVAITIITNSTASSDSMWTQVVFNQEWPELMKALPGSKLYLANTHETLHSKVYTFDDDIVVVGSYNFDGQGGSMNAEDVVIARSKALAAFVKTDLETYTRDRTTLYTIEDAHERKPVPGPKGEILKQKLLYPIGQQFRESL